MSAKKRILILFLIYISNLMFFLLCLTIDRKGMFSTLRYDGGMIAIICVIFLNLSFWEMRMVIHRNYCKRKFSGSVCIALNMSCKLQKVACSVLYLILFVLAFCDVKLGFLLYTVCILGIITWFCCGSGKFLWIVGDKKYYMNEYGELYGVNEIETKGLESVLTYENYRGKECKVRIKREITW